MDYPVTPDGRYFVVRGRLWRTSNPELTEAERSEFVGDLMRARRAVRDARGAAGATAEARSAVQTAKVKLGERGPVWWSDGSPDYNRHMVCKTPYRQWAADLAVEGNGTGEAVRSKDTANSIAETRVLLPSTKVR